MTIAEKIEMYREKNRFVEGLSLIFQGKPKGTSIEKITYEVYRKDINNGTYFYEWLVVHYEGGGYSPRTVNGNSNSSNFRVVGDLLDRGYYEELPYYEKMEEAGYERVGL